MKNIGGTSRFIGFIDECGDHSMREIDPDFPIFLLSLVIVQRRDYVEQIIPELSRLKLRYWNHEGVNLHSRDIRKSQGSFGFHLNPVIRPRFLSEMSSLMQNLPYSLVVAGVRKDHLLAFSADASANPYTVALGMAMESVIGLLKSTGERELPLVAETRGAKEDAELERAFQELMFDGVGVGDGIAPVTPDCLLVFRNKRDNIAGLQLADLAGHPCARHMLKPEQQNQAFEIVRQHVYSGEAVKGWRTHP